MIKSLAFVPAEEMSRYYNELYKNLVDADSKKVAIFLKTNYISGGGSKRKPRYEPSFWSVEDSIKNAFPRTQNSVEAWHRRLKVIVGKHNSGLYKIIEHLGKELIICKNSVTQIKAGHKFPKKLQNIKKYKNIKRVIRNRCSSSKMEYLKNIAYNIHLTQ